MSRCNLYATSTKLPVHIVVSNHEDRSVSEGQPNSLSDKCRISLILRVYRHGNVAKHSLGSRRGDDQRAAAVFQGIAYLPDLPVFLLAVHFEVGHRRAEHRVPVDKALAAVDQALLMKSHEHFDHGVRHTGVHGEVTGLLSVGIGKGPIGRGAEPAHLARDGRAGLPLPIPHAPDETLTAEIMAGFAFRPALAPDHDPRWATGVAAGPHPICSRPAHVRVP